MVQPLIHITYIDDADTTETVFLTCIHYFPINLFGTQTTNVTLGNMTSNNVVHSMGQTSKAVASINIASVEMHIL